MAYFKAKTPKTLHRPRKHKGAALVGHAPRIQLMDILKVLFPVSRAVVVKLQGAVSGEPLAAIRVPFKVITMMSRRAQDGGFVWDLFLLTTRKVSTSRRLVCH